MNFLSNMFVVCGIDTCLFWMGSSVVSFTAVFVLEYLYAVSGYLMAPSNFQCTDHDDVKWVELCSNYHGWLQVSACFPPILCARPITLAMVDEKWYFVQNYEIVRFTNICWILWYISELIFIWTLLIKDVHWDFLKICEIFWYLKMENDLYQKYKSTRNKRQARILHHKSKIIAHKIFPSTHSKW